MLGSGCTLEPLHFGTVIEAQVCVIKWLARPSQEYSCQPVQPEFLDKGSKFPGFYNFSLDIDISHDKMINSQKK